MSEEFFSAEALTEGPKSVDSCLIKQEKFDLDMAKHLVSSQDILTLEEKRRLKVMLKTREKGNVFEAKYKLGKNSDATPLRGQSEFEYIGRWCAYRGVGLQGLQHNIRGALAHKYYWDVDMVNAHPVMLKQICEKNGWICDKLSEYVNNREALFKVFQEENELFTRDYCKTAIISLMFGGKPNGWPSWLEEKLYPELVRIMKNIAKIYPEVYKKAKRSKPNNPLGCCCANVLQTEERKCLIALDQFMNLKGRYMGVLIHDGGYVEKLKDEKEFPESLLRQGEQFIYDKVGYRHKLLTKPITTDFEVPNKREMDINKTYPIMKKEFEETHFKNVEKFSFYEVTEDKVVIRTRPEIRVSYEHLIYEETNKNGDIIEKSFIDRWLKDPHMRLYASVGMYPPPLKCPEGVYNLWNGYKMENMYGYSMTEGDGFETLLEHIKLIAGEDCYEYMLNWIAFMIQKPAIRPNVAILIKSKPGIGKGMLYNILKAIMGSQYCYLTEKVERDILGDFNNMVQDKILTVFDEMSFAESKKCSSRIKAFITGEEMTINGKFEKKTDAKNFTHTLIFSNSEWPLQIEEGDRRFLAIDRWDEPIPPKEYFDRVNEASKSPIALSDLLDYFMGRDIKNFDPSRDRPKTSFFDDLKELCKPLELQFIVNLIEERDKDFKLSAKELFEEFKYYLAHNHTGQNINNYGSSSIKLALKLKSYQIYGIEHTHTKTGNCYNFNVNECKRWVIEKGHSSKF